MREDHGPATRLVRPPPAADDPLEAWMRLRTIVRGEDTTCQLLQLELAAAVEVIKPDPFVRALADQVVNRLIAAQQAYEALLAVLEQREPIRRVDPATSHPGRSTPVPRRERKPPRV